MTLKLYMWTKASTGVAAHYDPSSSHSPQASLHRHFSSIIPPSSHSPQASLHHHFSSIMTPKSDRQDVILALYRKVTEYGSVFLSIDDLKGLGVEASKVQSSEGGEVKFSPCFFLPHPENVLSRYPCLFDTVSALNPERPGKDLRSLQDPDEWKVNTRAIDLHMEDRLSASRNPNPEQSHYWGLFNLFDSTDIESFE
jgi:hypothetical protein